MKTTKSKKVTAPAPAAAPARLNTVTPTAKAPAAPAPSRGTTVTTLAAPPHRAITSDCIASRAYSLWEQQGRPHGRDLELWLQAEKQLKASQSFAA